jgi:hypothetical protein
MTWNVDGVRIVNAIREMRPGDWDASEGEVVDRILIMRDAKRRQRCCGQELVLVAEASHPSLGTWGLWRCSCCERRYSIGPKLPRTWVSALARFCIELYCDLQRQVAAAHEPHRDR